VYLAFQAEACSSSPFPWGHGKRVNVCTPRRAFRSCAERRSANSSVVTLFELPQAMFLRTRGASRRGLTVCRDVNELLTPYSLRRYGASLKRLHNDSNIT
jgi:hypothetical protein